MDSDHQRRQTNPSAYSTQTGILQSSSTYPPITATDRYRQHSLTSQSPTAAPTTVRSGGYGYGYGADGSSYVGQSMQTAGLQYPTNYSPEQARSSQYSQYGSNSLLYGVSGQQPQSSVQQQQQSAQPSAYDSVQPYPQRQNAAIEVLSSQFGGVGSVAQDYYVGGEGGPTSAPAVTMATQTLASQYPGLTYTAHSNSLGAGSIGQQALGTSSVSDVASAYAHYDNLLKRAFKATEDRRLPEAGTLLLDLSNWLLTNAEAFGLVRDDTTMHTTRLKMWEDFNNCWLTALQSQYEVTEEVVSAGQKPSASQRLMTKDFIGTMAREIIRLCDMMEKHGLVDYQMGVSEEEIIAMLIKCDDLMQDAATDSNTDTETTDGIPSRRRQ